MPWKAASVTDQRAKFMLDYNERVQTGQTTMFALCSEHGVSRKTGYKIVGRYQKSGWLGLADHSRAPLGGKHWIDPEVISAVLDVRVEFPQWGSRKIVAYLRDIEPDQQWPAASVVHEWIKRAGMAINHPGPQRRFPHPGRPPAVPIERPNQQWSTDFKGHFRTKDRRYCYPLTVTDSFSRYIIGCQALSGDYVRVDLAHVRATLSRVRATRCHAVRQRNAVLVQLGQEALEAVGSLDTPRH
jgi:hypothetical protein